MNEQLIVKTPWGGSVVGVIRKYIEGKGTK